ncbi:NAD(P)/FAD-dependent oxidoreductase [Frankia sp. CNm7]|nr:NAD(P)/FAD-dependent oxidoreductase [Frankia nepalensis]MBL7511108.1 NAD(P)/FAD-dependent oxidoreductase [Frankia nepalensis]MBL7521877.1 NAD(P)/FAD-dependent oxidoreductase [Frankia nepalensis]
MTERLAELEARLRRDLDLTAFPRPEWLAPRVHDGKPVHDVVIVGGGQAGLTVTFALRRRGVPNTVVLDEMPAGAEGPWTTYARMITLRTPKGVTGPDQGVPSLTPEAWYRAAFGDDAWEALGRIPREHWQAYLRWYRSVTGADVRNETRATGIHPVPGPDGQGPLVEVATTGGVFLARRVVLATGLAGNGEWSVPAVIRDNVPAERYVHTGAPVDFARFAGQRVGVLGGGASAFDYAGSALEAGAASVDLFYRRARVPRVNLFRWMEFYAFGAHFPDLPDEDRWKFTVQFQRTNQPPPQPTWYRCTRWDTFAWHTSAPWNSVRTDGDEIVVSSGAGEFRFDALISGTGPNVDFGARPELRGLGAVVATWADRYKPPAEWEDDTLLGYPYLGPGFEFTEREPGSAPWVERVHDFTYGARVSMGLNGNMNSGLGAGGRRLADAITRSLFLEDRDAIFASYRAYDVEELVDLGRPGESDELA